jgi:type IX secretion system PorP/SprF family membrane protein
LRKDFANNFLVADNVYFAYSPHISVGKKNGDSLRIFVIRPAIDIGFISYTLDWNKIVFQDTYDPYYGAIYGSSEVTNKESTAAPDIGTGMLIYGKNFSLGYYLHHATEPDMFMLSGPDALPARQELHGSYVLKDYKWLGSFVAVPSFLFTWQGELQKTDLSLSATYKKYTLGINARINSSFAFIAGFEHTFFKCGYAYEMNTTYAKKALGSSHEAVLSFKFLYRKEKKKIRTAP